MEDTDSTTGQRSFKKRSHRPWKPNLLENAIKETGGNADSSSAGGKFTSAEDLLPQEVSLESDTCNHPGTPNATIPNATIPNATIPNAAKPDLLQATEESFVNQGSNLPPEPSSITKKPLDAAVQGSTMPELHIDNINEDLQSVIREKTKQKDEIISKISDKTASSMLIGGFIQPGQIQSNDTSSSNGKKINRLMNDLQHKELELNSLANNLKIAQAIEQAEQAELAKQAEIRARLAAEKRMQESIEQANLASEQLQVAMTQARQAESTQHEEEKSRKLAEAQIEEANVRANNAELAMKAEQQARIAAEEKAKHALNQTVQTELSRQELEEAKRNLDLNMQKTLDQLRKSEVARQAEEAAHSESSRQLAELEKLFAKVNNERKDALEKLESLESSYKVMSEKSSSLEEKIHEALELKDKYQSIVESEQELRQIAERKMKEAKAQAARAEMARKAEKKQSKLIQERAQRAVSHASRTVMHFLNAPIDETLDYKIPKATPPTPSPHHQSPKESLDPNNFQPLDVEMD